MAGPMSRRETGMIIAREPERVIPARETRLYRYEELGEEAKLRVLRDWRDGEDFDGYSADAEDEMTWDDVRTALHWLDGYVDVRWETDAWNHIWVTFRCDDVPDFPEDVPELGDPELWCEEDIAAPYRSVLPTLRMAAYVHCKASEWEDAAEWPSRECVEAAKLMSFAEGEYSYALESCAEDMSKNLTKCVEEDWTYHRNPEFLGEFLGEVLTDCADAWFTSDGLQAEIPEDAEVEEVEA